MKLTIIKIKNLIWLKINKETKKIKIKKKKKIKLKFKKYTNAFNVSNNKLTSLNGIYEVLTELLPELTFKSKLGKVELLQWISGNNTFFISNFSISTTPKFNNI